MASPSAAILLVCASVIRENILPTSARSNPSATPPTSIVDNASRSATTRCDCDNSRPSSSSIADHARTSGRA